MKIQLVSIEINSGNSMHKLHRDVKGYEIPLLQLAHGDDNVKVLSKAGTIDVEIGPAEEYDRLIQLYARRDGELVRKAYRHPAELAEAMALCAVDEAAEQAADEAADGEPERKKPGRKPKQ